MYYDLILSSTKFDLTYLPNNSTKNIIENERHTVIKYDTITC